MPRKKRIICSGYCYHVMIRGVGGRSIFNDDQDRARFCLLLQYASETCGFNIHGFCLMENHVHLLLQLQTNELASGMHRLTFRYAQHYNKKAKHQGYLFQSRYKAILIQQGSYLRRLIRYIHRNPVRANLVGNLSDYSWSSHGAYLGDSEFTWLKTDLVLSLFGSEHKEALESFHNYVYLDDIEAKIELDEIRNSEGVGAYGNDLFITEFQKALETDSTSLVIGEKKEQQEELSESQTKITLEILTSNLCRITNNSLEELQSSSRAVELVDTRAILVMLALKFKLSNTSRLAILLRRNPTSIARLQDRAKKSPKILQLVDEISSTLVQEPFLERVFAE